ncbi:ABC transporter substrate-binding protein [Candidatus Margulisiibacteriota bacterium]
MKKHLKPLLLLIFLFLIIAAPITAKVKPKRKKPIVIGMSAALTGASKNLGKDLYIGSKIVFDEVNRLGGVHGRKLKLKILDDRYNPLPAVKNTVSFVEKDDVDLLYCFMGTPTVTRVLPLLKRYQEKNIYLFFPFTGAQPQRVPPYNQFAFNLRASYLQETKGLVSQFIKIKRKRIAVFYQSDAYGRSGWSGVKKGLADYGRSIIAEASYVRGAGFDQSFKEAAEYLLKQKPDAIISIGSYQACAGLIREMRDLGWDGLIANISFVGSESLLGLLVKYGKKVGKDYTKNIINSQVVPSYEDTSLPAVREYRKLMARNKSKRYSYVSFEGFLNAKTLVAILDQSGKWFNKSALPQVVSSIKEYDIGIKDLISFGSPDKNALGKVYYTTVKNNKFVPIKSWSKWKK